MKNQESREFTLDRSGRKVVVGTVVRVLAVPNSVLDRLDEQERVRVQSMVGGEFAVYEVDKWGGAWVEKWWHASEDRATSHSLALSPSEMEVIGNDGA